MNHSIYLSKIKKSFHQVSEWIFAEASNSSLSVILNLDAEDTLFVRVNNHKVRQNTQVEQANVKLQIGKEKKIYKMIFSLSGNVDSDLVLAKILFKKAVMEIDTLLEETVNLNALSNLKSLHQFDNKMNHLQIIDDILNISEGHDFTGIITLGPVLQIAKTNTGSHHEFYTEFVNVDYSLFAKEKAAKNLFTSSAWDKNEFKSNLDQTLLDLNQLKKPTVELKPDSYRVYLAPGAVSEIANMLSWGALSHKAFLTGRSPFKKLIEKEVSLSELLTIKENYNLGLGPAFNSNCELAPDELFLIENGKVKNLFTSTKTAEEFKVQSNFADEEEASKSLEIMPGNLPSSDILKVLNTGLYISNLHYLNWSDPMTARITGMTRYACYWVENGEIVGPIKDMRFDDSFYNLWGSELETLTDHSELEAQTMTYFQRHLGGKKVPGMIIKQMKFTL